MSSALELSDLAIDEVEVFGPYAGRVPRLPRAGDRLPTLGDHPDEPLRELDRREVWLVAQDCIQNAN